ncbi:hypothetical protein [Pelagibius marinus]|uniref:hypothetical protein n=1 Tax=Pelagibius marinus TaxID=2762760 RepID=UPI0018723B32|nr:hypothetical protein [Pelagibius marinus]
MEPAPYFVLPWPFVFGTGGDDFQEVILTEDDSGSLFIDMLEGDDTVVAAIANRGSFFLDLGAGDDRVLFDNTAVEPGNGKDSLLGGEGSDTLEGSVAIHGSFVADGGNGDDYFDFDATFFAYGSATVSGGAGRDFIDLLVLLPAPGSFNDPAAAGHFVIDAGDDDDTVNLTIDMKPVLLSSVPTGGVMDVDLGAGNDCLIFDLVGNDPTATGPMTLGPLRLSAGDGNDEVDVRASTGQFIDSIGMLNGNISTGAGDDSVKLNNVVLRNTDVDTGDGTDSISWIFQLTGENEVPPVDAEIHGGGGDDNFEIVAAIEDDTTGVIGRKLGTVLLFGEDGSDTFGIEVTLTGQVEFDILVDGGAGNDTIFLGFGFENISTSADYDPGLARGGDGNDTLVVFSEASKDLDIEDAFHVRGDAGTDTFVVSKGQETVIIDDFTLREDELFLDGIFSEGEFNTILISKVGPVSTGILDSDNNLIAVLQGIAPEDLTSDSYTLGAYSGC